jgi:hypothetical protein
MDYERLFPGRFLKAALLDGKDWTVTIAKVRLEEMEKDDGGKEVKGIVGFSDAKKEWVLNRTNATCLAAMFGRDTDGWIGKRVTLFPTTTGPKHDPCIRVRGSPDIERDVIAEVKLPRRKAQRMTLKRTGAPTQQYAQEPHQ